MKALSPSAEVLLTPPDLPAKRGSPACPILAQPLCPRWGHCPDKAHQPLVIASTPLTAPVAPPLSHPALEPPGPLPALPAVHLPPAASEPSLFCSQGTFSSIPGPSHSCSSVLRAQSPTCWLLWDLFPGMALCSQPPSSLWSWCVHILPVGGVRMVPLWPLPREDLEGMRSLKHSRAALNWGPRVLESMDSLGQKAAAPVPGCRDHTGKHRSCPPF